MDKVQIVKLVIRIIASASVGSVVGNIIKFNTPATLSVADKVVGKVGGFILSSMIAEKGADYVMSAIEVKPAETNTSTGKETK